MFKSRFGFLNYRQELNFDGGYVRSIEQFDAGLAYVEKYGNRDGYIYPPLMRTVTLDRNNQPIAEVSNTERPAAVFNLPLSHELLVTDPVGQGDIRREDAGLLVHLLAFFFGTRLQFEGWRFDGRVPTKPANSFFYREDVPQHFISSIYTTWKAWNPELRRRYINILYMHGRSNSCLWEWERFIYQYMVFDAIYRFRCLAGGCEIRRHRDRLSGLCQELEIAHDVEVLNKIYHLRNNLFHEALWDNKTPGQGPIEDHRMEKWLGKLNARLIVAIAGYTNKFSRSGWCFFGWEIFDKLDQD